MSLVLGIETSCDDTAAAVVNRLPDGRIEVLSSEVDAQHDRHAAFGGVVPEIAARSHVERIDETIRRALSAARIAPMNLDAIAATAGPGLIGGVMVGLSTGKAMALAHGKPLIPINHLEGHALSIRLTEATPFPFLLLLVSGGHTQLIWVSEIGRYERIGATIDDAAGEAFDKAAKLLGLGQPGGPLIEQAAADGRTDRFAFPEPLARREGCDFSFSGLKTALRLAAEAIPSPTRQDIADLSASFQSRVADHLAARTGRALDQLLERAGPHPSLVVAGGVAANASVRTGLAEQASRRGWTLTAPPAKYCTDNAAMIAAAGAERLSAGMILPFEDWLAFAPRARWPLAEGPKSPTYGGGRKGSKA